MRELRAPHTYDVIWAGSVLTHLNSEAAEAMVRTWLSWLDVGGVLIASTHGRTAMGWASRAPYFSDNGERWEHVLAGYQSTGYGYADYPGFEGHGVSLMSPTWISERVVRWPDARLVSFTEKRKKRGTTITTCSPFSASPSS